MKFKYYKGPSDIGVLHLGISDPYWVECLPHVQNFLPEIDAEVGIHKGFFVFIGNELPVKVKQRLFAVRAKPKDFVLPIGRKTIFVGDRELNTVFPLEDIFVGNSFKLSAHVAFIPKRETFSNFISNLRILRKVESDIFKIAEFIPPVSLEPYNADRADLNLKIRNNKEKNELINLCEYDYSNENIGRIVNMKSRIKFSDQEIRYFLKIMPFRFVKFIHDISKD